MRNAKLLNRFLGCFLVTGLIFGCSDSTGPTYPLTLTLLSQAQTPKNASVDTLFFQVTNTNNGKAVAGAVLISTTNPEYIQTNLGIESDSNGKFPALPITFNDTFSEIAYQAELEQPKVDTLISNPIDWSWY
jgi:hypothetical protein